ncbi:MAG: beta-propeller domain-containing protein [Eubacterium sp.]|nr:beta-propeller domain-containing protein [Eubacterium sp.]
MKKNDFDFIKEKFDNDGVKTPDSISEEAIVQKLPTKVKLYQKPKFKKAVSLVACFALLIGILSFALTKAEKPFVSYGIAETEIKTSEIKAFDNYNSIRREINNYLSAEKLKDILYGSYSMTGELATGGWDYSGSFGKTYVQVDGVDEADILKNDGKYIYYLNEHNIIFIYEGDRLVTKITDFAYENYDTSEYNYEGHYNFLERVEDMFVTDNKLVVNTYSHYDKNKDEDVYTYSTVFFTNSYIYDLSDISSPKLLKKFTNSGMYSTSRLIDDILYIVSNKSLAYYSNKYKTEDCYIYDGENDELTEIPASSIMYGENTAYADCVVMSAININTLERSADTKAFFGCNAFDVYCNRNNMYIPLYGTDSQIVKIELTENEIKFIASVTVKGYIHNQFSMNESDGYFRVATSDKKGNNLFVLDNKLNLVGSVTGFAEEEEIKSVNYIGDMAYVITYKEIDPLFAIDVSDPKNPVIKGSLEITGFSSQLVPIDENTLLGIGYEEGVKLVLFDISNPLDLKALDTYVIADSYSNAQYEHKAITINREKNYLAIDYYEDDEYGHAVKNCVLVLNTENKKINILEDYEVDLLKINEYDDCKVERTTYIGDTLYVLDSMGNIYSFEY